MTRRFNKVIGTGGIGTGLLFITDENRTLGRNESRLVKLSDAKDYCKQQIVLYYVAALLSGETQIYPVGCVGRDAYGNDILEDLKRMGMSIRYVARDDVLPTTISFCLQYPDKDGCNITASNGAADRVTPRFIREAMDGIGVDGRTLLAAIPEVRVEARMEMLREGRAHGGFCALSIPEAEAEAFERADAFRYCDLLAVNEREALALSPGGGDGKTIARRLYEKLSAINPGIALLVTCGKHGAYTAQDGRVEHVPAISTGAVNTTGAGDAFLGGVLAGLAMNLPLQKGRDDPAFGASALNSAGEVGALCAGMAVESMDSIAYHVNPSGIRERIARCGWQQTGEFGACFR